MKQELQAKLEELKPAYEAWSGGNITGRYKIGRQIKTIEKSYGDQGVKQIARGLGVSETWLYNSSAVARLFEQEKSLESWMKKRDASRDLPLSWSHLVEAAHCSDREEAKGWLQHALNEGLTVAELREAMKAEGSTELADGGGGPDPNLAKGLRSFQALAESVVSRTERWDATVIEPIRQQERLDEPTRAEAEKTLASLRTARDRYGAMVEDLEKVLKG